MDGSGNIVAPDDPVGVVFDAVMANVPPEVQAYPGFWDGLHAKLEARIRREAEEADREMLAIRKEYRDGVRANPAKGAPSMAIPATLYHHLRDHGFDSSSREDRATVARMFPDTKVKALASKPTFGPTGGLPGGCDVGIDPVGKVKFRKTYGSSDKLQVTGDRAEAPKGDSQLSTENSQLTNG